jgi:hypothetical protein
MNPEDLVRELVEGERSFLSPSDFEWLVQEVARIRGASRTLADVPLEEWDFAPVWLPPEAR